MGKLKSQLNYIINLLGGDNMEAWKHLYMQMIQQVIFVENMWIC